VCYQSRGSGKTPSTVRVADGEPGAECQVDFGYLGLLADPVTGRQRKVHALIFTACYSRHMFVWLSFTQALAAFIAGCEPGVSAAALPPGGPRCWRTPGRSRKTRQVGTAHLSYRPEASSR
jgi:hypothetical protein